MTVCQRIKHLVHSTTGLDNVFDDDNIPAVKVFADTYHFVDAPSGHCALIRSELDETYLAVEAYLFHQVTRKHERTVEHGKEQRMFARIVAVDALRHLFDTRQYLSLGKRQAECLVFYPNLFHFLLLARLRML